MKFFALERSLRGTTVKSVSRAGFEIANSPTRRVTPNAIRAARVGAAPSQRKPAIERIGISASMPVMPSSGLSRANAKSWISSVSTLTVRSTLANRRGRAPVAAAAGRPMSICWEENAGEGGGEVEREEGVDRRQQPRARQALAQPAEQRHQREHRDEGGGEQPLQRLGAGFDRERVAHRAQQVVAAQQEKKVGERPGHCRRLVRLVGEKPVDGRGHAL